MKPYFLFITLFFFSLLLPAQSPPGVYVIFDASGSMWGRLEDNSYKIQTAREVLTEFVAGDFEGKELALRVYGHRREKDCTDSELVVPFGPPEQVVQPFQKAIEGINPKGRTPISRSLRQALEDFGDREGDIILISDGIETCDEDPCALMKEWREKNINIQVHVVGFGVEEKAKLALECIADAAGTPYHDAGSSEELEESLSEIQEKPERTVLVIKGRDAEGEEWKINGYLEQNGNKIQDVQSHFHNEVISGSYTLVAGIQTRNGNLYQPIRQEISLPPLEETVIELSVSLPPRVSSKFMEKEVEQTGSLISAYQDGKEVFRFRPIDEVFVDEGSYEFRTKPNEENELTVKETLRAGDRKELLFQMVQTVRVYLRFEAESTGDRLGTIEELLQEGEVKYKFNGGNGRLLLPGTYEVRSRNYLYPLPFTEIQITQEEQQEFTLTVPTGIVTFRYLNADGSPDKDDRVFVGLAGSNNTKYQRGGAAIAFPPGSYVAKGWKHKGTYDPVSFEVVAGQEQTVVLRKK